MSWLDNYVRPRIQQLVRRAPSPQDLWRQCDDCTQMIFHRDLEQAMMVCPNCGHHMRIGAEQRFKLLLDAGSREDLVMPEVALDPLKFRDQKRYTERLKDAHNKNGGGDALKAASGTIEGVPAVVTVLDFSFMGGSMGAAVGAGFLAAVQKAVENKAGFIAVTASGGARMQEGILSLMQMPRTVAALGLLKDAGLPYITVLTDPTTGGVSASFAMLGDVAIAEPLAAIGFAGQRVIKETIGQTLPDGFQRAEYLLDHGMLDIVAPRDELKATVGCVLSLLLERKVEEEPVQDLVFASIPVDVVIDTEEQGEPPPPADTEVTALKEDALVEADFSQVNPEAAKKADEDPR
jgi:acetyl-CoA carboxylase carboxyl transferase subunit beta